MKLKAIIALCLCSLITNALAQNKKGKQTAYHPQGVMYSGNIPAVEAEKTDTVKKAQPKMNQPQVFKGLRQYRTWTVGVHAGLLAGSVLTGGSNDYHVNNPKLGFGISVRKQFGHVFGLQFDGLTGHVAGSVPRDRTQWIASYNTELGYDATLSMVANLGGMSYMKRQHRFNFFFLGGMGFMGFAPTVTDKSGIVFDTKGYNGVFKNKTYIHEFDTFGGFGIRFHLSNRLDLSTGYTEHFIDNDFLDGIHNVQVNSRDFEKDKFSYGYFGLEYSIGKKVKPEVEWINPASMLYDAQVERSIHEEFELLRIRTENVERNMIELKKDSDGDGIPDWMDKCAATAAGTKVDANGCPVVTEAPAVAQHVVDTLIKETIIKEELLSRLLDVIAKQNIQFNINSAEIPARYYNNLDDVAKALKASPAKTVTVTGYASTEGSVQHNIKLSAQRANAVKAYLIKAGAAESQIKVEVSGKEKPVASNKHEEGRVINRRVEIH